MTINLDKNAEKKLKKELKNILVQANVICGDRLDGGTIFGMLGLDTAIFQNKKDKNKTYLKDFISESPMYYFFNQQLSEFIRQHNEYDKDAETKKLSDLKGLEDINDVVDNLVTDFKSLPWSYSLLLFLDDSLTESFKGMSAINVTDKRISFIKVNETFCKNFPQIKKRKIGLFVSDETAIKIDNYCIQIFEDGLINQYSNTNTFDNSVRYIKSFFGLGLAIGLFDTNKNNIEIKYQNPFGSPARTYDIQVHIKNKDIWEIVGNKQLDAVIGSFIKSITLHKNIENISDLTKRSQLSNTKLVQILAPLNDADLTTDLLLASQWYFDSISGNDDLFVKGRVKLYH